jgi:hypothetical protein
LDATSGAILGHKCVVAPSSQDDGVGAGVDSVGNVYFGGSLDEGHYSSSLVNATFDSLTYSLAGKDGYGFIWKLGAGSF